MRPTEGDARREILDQARGEVWTAMDHLSDALQGCLSAGDYRAACEVGVILNALWNLVRPVEKADGQS